MQTIYNIDRLDLSEDQLSKLVKISNGARRSFSMTWSVLKADDEQVLVSAKQHKPNSGNIMSSSEIVKASKQIFEMFSGGRDLHISPVVYKELPTDIVTSKWLNDQMTKFGISTKKLAEMISIDRSYLSGITSGAKPLSKVNRSLFFHFFKVLELRKEIDLLNENFKEDKKRWDSERKRLAIDRVKLKHKPQRVPEMSNGKIVRSSLGDDLRPGEAWPALNTGGPKKNVRSTKKRRRMKPVGSVIVRSSGGKVRRFKTLTKD